MASKIIISGTRTAEDLVREHLQRQLAQDQNPPPQRPARNPGTGTPPITRGDYITLDNITCTDADGIVFEQYDDRILVATDVARGADNYASSNVKKHISFTPYQAIRHFEQQNNGLFLPSFALTCNIVAALYQGRSNPQFETVLQQYKNYGPNYGYHAQNTIVNFTTGEMIDYPSSAELGQATEVNATKRKKRNFSKSNLQDCALEDGLRDIAHQRFVKQLTGLVDPSVLVNIGTYFGRPGKLWFPWNGRNGATYTGTHSAWFGCNNTNRNLNANNNLGNTNAARGVRRA